MYVEGFTIECPTHLAQDAFAAVSAIVEDRIFDNYRGHFIAPSIAENYLPVIGKLFTLR